jgi:hypothetical protein
MSKRRREVEFIDWRNSQSKHALWEDLIEGVVPLKEEELSSEDAWNFVCKEHPVLVQEGVGFEQFKRQFDSCRKKIAAKTDTSNEQEAAFLRTCARRTESTHCPNGRRIFRNSPAHPLLLEDVRQKLHLGMTPALFRLTRDEHKEWKIDEFRPRICQAERHWKFINYLEKNERKRKPKKPISDDSH